METKSQGTSQRCQLILQQCLAIQLSKPGQTPDDFWMYDSGYMIFQVYNFVIINNQRKLSFCGFFKIIFIENWITKSHVTTLSFSLFQSSVYFFCWIYYLLLLHLLFIIIILYVWETWNKNDEELKHPPVEEKNSHKKCICIVHMSVV